MKTKIGHILKREINKRNRNNFINMFKDSINTMNSDDVERSKDQTTQFSLKFVSGLYFASEIKFWARPIEKVRAKVI